MTADLLRMFVLKSLLVLFVGASCSAVGVHAQSTATVSGFVRDAETRETLLLANVVLAGTGMGSATNNSGYYAISGIRPGLYTLSVSYLGYTTFTRELTLTSGQELRLDVELSPVGFETEEVVVSADRDTEAEQRQLGATRMNTALIKELPTVLEPDVFRSLQLLPGVKAASDYSSGLYIRGGSPDQTLILLDGTTVYNPSHFFGFFSTFNPDAIKDVRLYKGAYPARFGGRIGSVVDIYNKDGNRNETHATASLGLLASRAMVEGPHGRGSWMLAVRRSTLEPLLSFARSQDVGGLPDMFYFVDANGKVNVDVGANDFVSVSFYAGQDVLRLPLANSFDVGLRYGNRTVSANWTHLFSDKLFSDFTATRSSYFSVPQFNAAGTASKRDNQVRDWSLKADLEYFPSSRRTVSGGVWAGLFTLRLNDTFDSQDVLTLEEASPYASAFVEEKRRLGLLWTVTGGVRASWFSRGEYFRIEPRLSVERQLAPGLFGQLGYGRYSQYLTLISNEAFSGLDVWLTSANRVPPAWGDQVVAGLKWDSGQGVRIEGETYLRSMKDLFQLDPFLPDVAGLDYDEFFHFGEGYAYGAELFVEKQTGRISGFLGYTFGITRRRFETIDENAWFSPKYDRTHDLNLTTSLDVTRKWRLTSVFSYATGQAYTEPASQYRLSHSPFTRTSVDVLVSPFNRARLPAYHRLDIGATRRGKVFGADLELLLQVVNVYARRNIWFYLFEFEDDGTVTREDVPQIPVPVPNISVTLTL
jgi:hypothetical protein